MGNLGRKSQSLAALRAHAASMAAGYNDDNGQLEAPDAHDLYQAPYGSSPERLRRLEQEVQRRKQETIKMISKFDNLQPLLTHAKENFDPYHSPKRGKKKGGKLPPVGSAESERIRMLEERLARIEIQEVMR